MNAKKDSHFKGEKVVNELNLVVCKREPGLRRDGNDGIGRKLTSTLGRASIIKDAILALLNVCFLDSFVNLFVLIRNHLSFDS